MNYVFVSNYYNHHQSPFSEAMSRLTKEYHFIETAPMDDERKALGWGGEKKPGFVMQSFGSDSAGRECRDIINSADVVIWGSCPYSMITPRLKSNKLTFCYSERVLKKGSDPINYLGHLVKYRIGYGGRQDNHYLLCASAYAAEDYARLGMFKGRAYKWGYFPVIDASTDACGILKSKKPHSALWAGRFIDWKHPEAAMMAAAAAKRQGLDFELCFIGSGPEENKLRELIKENGLESRVKLLGQMPPEKVRQHMRSSQIFLFTSDKQEGWGAVVNEAMSEGCAVIASDEAGSVPYLIPHGSGRGLTFRSGDQQSLNEHLIGLLSDEALCGELGTAAMDAIRNEWNAEIAAKRFIDLSERLAAGADTPFESGPCSRA